MSNYSKTTDFAAKDSLPSGDAAKIIRGSEFETEFDNISTAIATKADSASPTFTGTVTIDGLTVNGNTTLGNAATDTVTVTADIASNLIPSADNTHDLGASGAEWKDLYVNGTANVDSLTLTSGSTVTTILDEDDLSSDSATALVTQQSIKAYVDAQVTAQDLDFQADSGGALSIDLDSETMTFTGGTGIDTSGSGNAVTFAIDSTVATLTGTQTLTNKTLTSPDVNTPDIDGGTIDGTVIGGTTPAAGSFTTGSFTGNVTFGDNDKAIFGAGSDLQIFHDGSNSRIQDAGTGNLLLRANAAVQLENTNGDNMLFANAGGSVDLYHNASKKLETTSTGVDVTGTVVSDGLNASTGDITTTSIGFDGSRTTTPDDLSYPIIWRSAGAHPDFSSGDLVIQARSDADRDIHFVTGNTPTERMNIDGQTGDISFYEDTGTTAKLTWDASAESLNFADNSKAIFGAGSDLQIYHDGNNSFIDDQGTGSLVIQSNGAYTLIQNSSGVANARFDSAGAASLRYNGAEKLATTSTGIDVTGTVTATDLTLSDSVPQISLTDSDGTDQISKIFRSGANLIIRSRNNTDYGTTIIQRDNGTVQNASVARFDASGDISFYEDTGTTAQFFWDASTERLGIGNSAPTTALDVTGTVAADGLTVQTAGVNYLKADQSLGSLMIQTNGANNRAFFSHNGDVSLYEDTGTTAKLTWDASDEDLRFADNSKAVFGTGSDLQIYHNGNNSFITDTGTGGLYLRASDSLRIQSATNEEMIKADANGPVTLYHDNASRLATTSTGIDVTGTVTADGLTVDSSSGITVNGPTNQDGKLNLVAYAGVQDAEARIQAARGNTSGTDSRLQFLTNNGTSLLTRVDINDNGDISFYEDTGTTAKLFWDASAESLGIGTSSPAQTFVVAEGTNQHGIELAPGSLSYIQAYDRATSDYGDLKIDAQTIQFGTDNGTERMRIDASGNLLVGTTSQTAQLTVNNGGNNYPSWLQNSSSSVDYPNRVISSYATGGQTATMFLFLAANGDMVGSIKSTVTTTTYNTSSDQRLKENIVDAPSASDDIDAIQVRSFDWKADGSHQKYGMVAQELQSVAPEAVSGDADSDDMMGVDYSKLVPMLVKEIQSLRARVAQLEGAN